MKRLFLALIALAALAFLGTARPTGPIDAASPGATVNPLLGCPDVDGSGGVRISDVTKVVGQYGNDSPGPNYRFIYDVYGPNGTADGVLRVTDISKVVANYGRDNPLCPLVDTQVAKATLWALANAPLTEDVAALSALGYTRAGPDVPGQGVHYANFTNWADGVFNLQAPEALVYHGGKLAAQLYVSEGSIVGWVGEDPTLGGPCNDGIDNDDADTLADGADPDCFVPQEPSGPPPDDIDIDKFCYPAPCSWDGGEGWHLHYRLCRLHIGTPNADLTLTADAATCQSANNSGCSPPPYGCGEWSWSARVGWMGHLWNHLPNANLVPDYPDYIAPSDSLNGRFADCFPDTLGWKAYNCPQ